MRLTRAIISLTLMAATISAQTRSTWVTLAPKGAGFSISVPAKPASRTLTRPTYTMHMFTVKVGNAAFSVSYGHLEPNDPSLKAGLDASVDEIINGMRGTLTSRREIRVDGHSGIEFTFDSVLGEMRGQLFLVGNRMFQMMTIVDKGADETKNVNRFFASLKLARG